MTDQLIDWSIVFTLFLFIYLDIYEAKCSIFRQITTEPKHLSPAKYSAKRLALLLYIKSHR